MPRPRKITIPLRSLECFETIEWELQSMPGLEDFDINNAAVTLKQRKPPYTVKPENLEKALESLREYISMNNITEPVELSKKQMSDILGISRPTVDKWINAGFIQQEVYAIFHGNELYYYSTNSILNGLEDLLSKQ